MSGLGNQIKTMLLMSFDDIGSINRQRYWRSIRDDNGFDIIQKRCCSITNFFGN